MGSKNKSINEISRMLFSNMDFNFPYFAHFNFVHFEIEKYFGLIWVKLQSGYFHLQISISGSYMVLVPGMSDILLILCIKESLDRFG